MKRWSLASLMVAGAFLASSGNAEVSAMPDEPFKLATYDSGAGSYMIHDVPHLLRYATSVMTLWPGDVIATGTPSGVGHGRNPRVYLQPDDVVAIEIEGIGTLVTPIR